VFKDGGLVWTGVYYQYANVPFIPGSIDRTPEVLGEDVDVNEIHVSHLFYFECTC
jgi:hypothetical protein